MLGVCIGNWSLIFFLGFNMLCTWLNAISASLTGLHILVSSLQSPTNLSSFYLKASCSVHPGVFFLPESSTFLKNNKIIFLSKVLISTLSPLGLPCVSLWWFLHAPQSRVRWWNRHVEYCSCMWRVLEQSPSWNSFLTAIQDAHSPLYEFSFYVFMQTSSSKTSMRSLM